MGDIHSRCSDCDEYEEKKVEVVKKTGEETGLKMKTMDCDWMISTNQEAHHTGEYENELLVLRRGQTFTVKATFQRKLSPEFDQIFLEFTTGPKPQLINNTKIRCPLVDELQSGSWGMKVVDEEEKEVEEVKKSAQEGGEDEVVKKTLHIVTFEVNIPPKTVVGKYETFIEFCTKLEDGTTSKSRDHEPQLYIIFNPWCVDDEVYMEDEDERQEYCLADTGIIYRGSTRRQSPKYWNFGQFEAKILDCVLSLLDKDKRMANNPNKWMSRRANPVWVSRVIPYMVNELVLVGNWSGDYSGGTSPVKWNGSVKILTEHFDTQKPVMYGQCWVFSGVVTSALRALGIPTRSVTNFASAHDTEGSMTIDKYLDEDGEEVNGLSSDSVWNFHVWNESWMKRPDLPHGYDGWQAVDATPQEESLGLYQTGPAPITAIKNGEVYLGFETGFVFAEVNADRVTWIVTQDRNDGNYVVSKKANQYRRAVGKFISTKQVGKDARLDLTNDYKFREGSEEEREAFNKAHSFGSALDYHKGFLNLKEEGEGITIDIDELAQTFHGDDIKTNVNLTNDTPSPVTVNVSAVLYSTSYTGEKQRFIKRIKYTDVKIDGNGKVTQAFEAGFKDYHGKMSKHQSFRLTVAVKVQETNEVFADDAEFDLENKDIVSIEVEDEELIVGKTYTVKVKLENPLPVKMNGIEITLEGPGLSYPVTKPISRTLEIGESLEEEFEVKPTKSGRKTLLVDVDSKQIQDLKTSKKIPVIKNT